VSDGFNKTFDAALGDDPFSDITTEKASNAPYAWNNSGIGRYGANDPGGSSNRDNPNRGIAHAREAQRQGFINESEFDWLISVSDKKEKRSLVEKLLGYKSHTGGVLGALDDVFGVIETVSGYRMFLSASAAVTQGLKEKGTWGFAFSTDEFKRAWTGEMSDGPRTSYRDIWMMGGSEMRGLKAGAGALAMDIALDPSTYLSFGVASGSKIALKSAAKTGLSKSSKAKSAAAILQESTGAAQIPTNLTLSRWGETVYQAASKELVELMPERLQKLVAKMDSTDPSVSGRAGIEALTPSDLGRLSSQPWYKSAVAEYMVQNYDRLALRVSGWEDKAALTRGLDVPTEFRANIRRGPGSLFQEWAGKAIGGYRSAGKKGNVESLFQETASFMHKERGLKDLGRASAVAQAGFGAVTGDLGMVGNAIGAGLLTEVPALGKTVLSAVMPTSAIRALDKSFRAGIERMPAEDAALFQQIKDGVGGAVASKKAELVDFFDAKVVNDVVDGNVVPRKLQKADREIIARHLDNPDMKLIDETSPLYGPSKWVEEQFSMIAQQERELGMLGDSWEHYVTHYYGSRIAGAVTKFFRNSNRTRRLVAELDRTKIANRNSFAMHRVIATFDDAERAFGAGAVDTDIASILARRWSASLRLQGKVKAQAAMIEKHGIDALGEGFKHAHAAIGEIGEKLGALTRSYIDTGVPQRVSQEEVVRLADSFTDAATVKNANWFATSEGAVAKIRQKRIDEAKKKFPPRKRGRPAAIKAAAEMPVSAEEISKATRNANLKALDKISKSAFGKPVSRLSSGEFEALRDYLNLTVRKSDEAIKQFEKIGRMNNVHRLALTEISGGVGSIRTKRVGHSLEREAVEHTPKQLEEIGRAIASRRKTETGTLHGDIRKRTDAGSPERAKEFADIGREAVASRAGQSQRLIRDVIDEGLQKAERKAKKRAKRTRRVAKSLRASVPAEIKKAVAEASGIKGRIDAAQKALGDHNAATRTATRAQRETVRRVNAEIKALGAKLALVRERIARGVHRGDNLRGARVQAATLSSKIDEKTKLLREAKRTLWKEEAGPKKVAAALSKKVDDLKTRQATLATELKDAERYINRWTRARKVQEGAKAHDEAVETLRGLREAEQKLAMRGDKTLSGSYYVPEVWLDAIDEAFGHTWNPSDKIDRFLGGYQQFQLLWKIPYTLPFFEHHGRNFITNAFLVSGHVGLRMLNPKNWIDAAAVVGLGVYRGTFGKETDVARSLGKTANLPKGMKAADLEAPLRGHMIPSVNGNAYAAEEIYRQAFMRGVTQGFVANEIDAVNGVFGDLFRGRMIPNIGMLRTVADSFAGAQKVRYAQAMKEEGAIGGVVKETAGAATRAAAGFVKNSVGGARWLARKSEHVVDVPFRLAIFTDAVKRGKSFDEAAEEVRKHLNDWSRLSKFEKKYMRTLVPFYSWVQFSMERFFRDVMTNPTAMTNPLKATKAIQDSMGATPPTPDYQSDWMAERVGIWSEEGDDLYKKYLINGINADEAARQVIGLTEVAKMMGHRVAKMTGQDELAWKVFAPDANPRDDLRFLAQIDFLAGTLIEGFSGRDLFSGSPTGTVREVLNEEGYSRYQNAAALVHPSRREKVGARWLRAALDVSEAVDGDPKQARAVAWRRWLLGRSPAGRFIGTYERREKAIIAALDSGDVAEAGKVSWDGALEALGTRAYVYDPERGKMYFNRDRINAAQNLLLNAGYYKKYGRVYVPKGQKPRK